ncbi:MAG: hypothetical protein BIFFINMI_03552 [Phycisphaerae bacterium]|nr:hypothetical protein [Phycisphaerae bacterium]
MIGRSAIAIGLALLAVLSGCRKSDPRPVHLPWCYCCVVDATGSPVGVWVNGQPVIGPAGTATYFVIRGRNEVRVTAGPTTAPDADEGRLAVDFCRYDEAMAPNVPVESRVACGRGALEVSFEVEAKLRARWVWQDADDLGPLTDADRAAMLAIYDDLVAGLRARDAGRTRAILLERSIRWSDGPAAPEAPWGERMWHDEAAAGLIGRVLATADYAFRESDRAGLTFTAGTRVSVLHRADGGPLFVAGHAEPVVAGQSLSPTEFYFLRRGGRWLLIWAAC